MKKILLIDDDIDLNHTMAELLESEEYEVISALNGQQGLDLFKQHAPDLIITDIVMPEKDGIEVILELMDENGKFPCPIIAISGGGRIGSTQYLEVAQNFGVENILEKPFTRKELLDKIGGHFS